MKWNYWKQLSEKQMDNLKTFYYNKLKKYHDQNPMTAEGQMSIFIGNLWVHINTVKNIMANGVISKKSLEKLDFIINK